MKIQSVAILGAGAVGCYVLWGLADKAAANSLQLCVVAEGSRAERLRQNGCTINGQVYPPQVWTSRRIRSSFPIPFSAEKGSRISASVSSSVSRTS